MSVVALTHVAAALPALPLALDGESASNGNAALAVVSVASMVVGYLLIAALWYFVFSAKARERRNGGRRDRAD